MPGSNDVGIVVLSPSNSMSHRLVMRAEIPRKRALSRFGFLPLAAGKPWEILRRFRRPLGLRAPSLIGVTVSTLLQKINVVEMMWDTVLPPFFARFRNECPTNEDHYLDYQLDRHIIGRGAVTTEPSPTFWPSG
jgi:hypothetical protein